MLILSFSKRVRAAAGELPSPPPPIPDVATPRPVRLDSVSPSSAHFDPLVLRGWTRRRLDPESLAIGDGTASPSRAADFRSSGDGVSGDDEEGPHNLSVGDVVLAPDPLSGVDWDWSGLLPRRMNPFAPPPPPLLGSYT